MPGMKAGSARSLFGDVVVAARRRQLGRRHPRLAHLRADRRGARWKDDAPSRRSVDVRQISPIEATAQVPLADSRSRATTPVVALRFSPVQDQLTKLAMMANTPLGHHPTTPTATGDQVLTVSTGALSADVL
jgi:hypothetical protein